MKLIDKLLYGVRVRHEQVKDAWDNPDPLSLSLRESFGDDPEAMLRALAAELDKGEAHADA